MEKSGDIRDLVAGICLLLLFYYIIICCTYETTYLLRTYIPIPKLWLRMLFYSEAISFFTQLLFFKFHTHWKTKGTLLKSYRESIEKVWEPPSFSKSTKKFYKAKYSLVRIHIDTRS